MNKEVLETQLRAVVPMDESYAVFLGNDEKTFVIYVDGPVGMAIAMSMRGIAKERPLTHDLLGHVLRAFGAKVERVVINHLENGVFHARIIITAENELQQRKVVELDARPSDSIALAVAQNAPMFVSHDVWAQVENVSEMLHEIEKRGDGGRGRRKKPEGEE
ncbi:MAG: bifunctional nuclease family protein [Verrucomicrobia bacterium]|nr:bifunctional nuclease family protein [Verrucomicrobiota bacterium]